MSWRFLTSPLKYRRVDAESNTLHINFVCRYVPPHLRKNPQQGRATRSTPQGIPGSGRSSVSSVSSPQPSPTQHVAPLELDSNLNGGKRTIFLRHVRFFCFTHCTFSILNLSDLEYTNGYLFR